jgi:hypothetical protein
MRMILPGLALLLLGGPVSAEPPTQDRPATSANQQIEALASPGAANCRDRIVAVRQERGLPPLEEGKAEPERPPAALDREPFHPGETEALLVYAVDREIDGCDVLVMAGNPEDVRPLPQLAEEDWRVRPAAQRNR